MKYRLGRTKSFDDPRTLRFAKYLKPEALAPPPVKSDWYSRVSTWPVYGNDSVGDCVIAALAHQQNSWTTYASGTEGGPSLAQVLDVYSVLSPNDTGTDMLTALKYVAKHGLGGAKIAAYVALDLANLTQAQLAIQMFGSIFIGLSLPDAIGNAADPLRIPWSVPKGGAVGKWAPDPTLGHAIAGVGYRPSRYPKVNANVTDVVTWGKRITFGWSAYASYVDEVYALVSTQWIAANGFSPSGFDLAQLLADRAAVAALPSPP